MLTIPGRGSVVLNGDLGSMITEGAETESCVVGAEVGAVCRAKDEV